MGRQMQKVISNCKQCIQHEGTWAKVPVQPIISTPPLELLHVDFTSIEMTMELDQPPNVVNVLVFCHHFKKHIMANVTPDQTTKTVAKSLYQGYISIYRTQAKLLSDWGANFKSKVVKELCDLMGIWKVSVQGQNSWYTKQGCRLDWYPSIRVLAACCQVRFSLYSGVVITKVLATVVSLLSTSGIWLCEVILCCMPLA